MSERSVLIPHLVVRGAVKAVEFYKAVLGAEEVSRMPTADGRLLHVALKVRGADLFLCDDFPEHCGGESRAPAGPSAVTLHLCVPCADTAIATAAGAGATVKMPAADMFWGDRYGQIVDPFGHNWSFSHPLTAEQKAEAEKQWAESPFNKAPAA